MKKITILSIFFLLGILLLDINTAIAQCAMCRVSVENNMAAGDMSVGAGLNMGILYLGTLPYLCFVALGFLWYKYSKKHTAEKEEIDRILSKALDNNDND